MLARKFQEKEGEVVRLLVEHSDQKKDLQAAITAMEARLYKVERAPIISLLLDAIISQCQYFYSSS
jgi:uncharacterized membrane protein